MAGQVPARGPCWWARSAAVPRVRILRDDESRESPVGGLYPVGEGAGYAGGIVSAAVDGLKTAKAIIRCYARA